MSVTCLVTWSVTCSVRCHVEFWIPTQAFIWEHVLAALQTHARTWWYADTVCAHRYCKNHARSKQQLCMVVLTLWYGLAGAAPPQDNYEPPENDQPPPEVAVPFEIPEVAKTWLVMLISTWWGCTLQLWQYLHSWSFWVRLYCPVTW